MATLLEYVKVFATGGLLCLIGQVLIDKTSWTPGRILVAYVTVGAALSAVGLYKYLVDFAGAGATVPLTGFGHLLAQGARRGVAENGLLGAFTGGVTAASAGITAAVLFGYAAAVFAKPKDKK